MIYTSDDSLYPDDCYTYRAMLGDIKTLPYGQEG